MRQELLHKYIKGSGIEIGALHNPSAVPTDIKVKYIDRLPVSELRRQYPELADKPLVQVDIIDDGERLTSVANSSQDFIIANHFLEHCQDPIGTLKTFHRVLVIGGIAFIAVPDKLHSFDINRPITPLWHLRLDHAIGPWLSRKTHFKEWAVLVNRAPKSEAEKQSKKLMEGAYSIHFHVWDEPAIKKFFEYICTKVGFKLEIIQRNDTEIIVILLKLTST